MKKKAIHIRFAAKQEQEGVRHARLLSKKVTLQLKDSWLATMVHGLSFRKKIWHGIMAQETIISVRKSTVCG